MFTALALPAVSWRDGGITFQEGDAEGRTEGLRRRRLDKGGGTSGKSLDSSLELELVASEETVELGASDEFSSSL
jgi:hypothetical protein